MAEQEENTEKEHEPTQKKLDDARKKGEVPKSVDLMTASGYLGILAILFSVGQNTLSQIGSTLASVLGQADRIAQAWKSGDQNPLMSELVGKMLAPVFWWFAVPAALVLGAIFAQRAFVVAPERIKPKASRISPLSNMKNKFGRSGLFEFFKSTLKLIVYSTVLLYFLAWNFDLIVATVRMEPGQALSFLERMTVFFLTIVFVIALSLGLIDLIFQLQEHQRKNRMSRKELMDETKQSEGDPHLKQKRRQRAQELATNKMLEDIPDADVVIVNPTHFAVALKWNRASGSAPTCVAKGVDLVALRIREIAKENAVPIRQDAPTARALFATTDIGMEIDPEHYQAVAAAIRFAEKIRQKAGALK